MKIVSIIVAILLFSVIILFHELGHFLLAKANGICVHEFCLGFGPTLIGFTKGETTYSLKLLPFGGACMMEGEDGESSDERAFSNKSVWARMSVVFAGPFFNFLMAFIFSFILLTGVGYQSSVISGVINGYSAQKEGLRAGDQIVKIDNFTIHFYGEISMYQTFHEGETVTVTYKRGQEEYTAELTPKYDKESGRYLYGVTASSSYQKLGVVKAFEYSFYEVRYWIYVTIQSLKSLVTRAASLNDLSGPVGIVTSVGETYSESVAQDGYFYAFMNMLNWGILLAANLGVMNLLPLPALDGGRLLFLIVEAIRRKKIDPEKEGMVHAIGMVLLLLLMAVIMFNDIRKLFM